MFPYCPVCPNVSKLKKHVGNWTRDPSVYTPLCATLMNNKQTDWVYYIKYRGTT